VVDLKTYTFFLVDGAGEPSAFEIGHYETEEAVKAKAQELLGARPRYVQIEVSDGSSSFVVNRATSSEGIARVSS
jgi:hypothetical protein